MDAQPRPQDYALLQKWLHWLVAFAVFGLVPVGVVMANRAEAKLFDDLTNNLYSGHKLMGFVVLWLMVARILAKRRLGAPAPLATLTRFERIASTAVHHGLYAMLVITPLVGWAGVSAYPAREVFGLFSLPPIAPVSEALAAVLFKLHKACAFLTILLVLAHLGGALMHGLIKQDGVLNRMIGWWPLRR
jgi:cytochrome b561